MSYEEQVDWDDESDEPVKQSSGDSSSRSSNRENPNDKISLKLGDIIEIVSPSNSKYHQKTFFIDYIDDHAIEILDVTTGFKHTLTIYETGQLTDESITQIILLSRAPEEGYVRQNGLTTGKWINVHFGGEIPTVISGEITNVDEDMIEIVTYPDTDIIYLNFEYKGIPKDLPIEKIEIREPPKGAPKSMKDSLNESNESNVFDDGDVASMSVTESGEIAIIVPDKPRFDPNFNDLMKELILDIKDIEFGEEEEIQVRTEVKRSEQRYGIDIQLNDLLDELLSTIPANKRSEFVMRRIYTIVRRFKELREKFSTFDENGNVTGYNNFDAAYKPLTEHLTNMDRNLRWILPVIKQRTKIYCSEKEFDGDAVSVKSSIMDLIEMDGKKQTYENYSTYYENIDSNMTPFEEGDGVRVNADLYAIVDNLDNYYTNVYNKTNRTYQMGQRRFVIQKYNMGLTKMHQHVMKSGKTVYLRGPMTLPDKMDMKSALLLPNAVVDFSRVDLPSTSVLDRVNRSHNWFYYHRYLKSRTQVDKVEEYDEEGGDFLTSTKEFNVDDMDAAIPRSRAIIKMMRDRIPDPYNFHNVIAFFEPFLLYADNITYSAKTLKDKKVGDLDVKQGGSYQEIRFHVKEMVKKYKAEMATRGEEFGELASKKYEKQGKPAKNIMLKVLAENNEFLKMIEERYGLNAVNSPETSPSSETLVTLMNSDAGSAYMSTVSLMMGVLFKPDLARLIASVDGDADGTLKSKSCATRSIAKKYTSVSKMQEDNNIEDVFFDKEYDDTPYNIMKQYEEDKGKMLPEKFVEYLKMVLVEKHDANYETVEELAANLISGQRRVRPGNYAMLEIAPKALESDKSDNSIEEMSRKKTTFYVRRKNNWIREDVDDDTFCNLSPGCYLNEDKKKATCDDAESTVNRLRQNQLSSIDTNRIETMIQLTAKDMETELKTRAKYHIDLLKKIRWIKDSTAKQHSIYAYMLGTQIKESSIVVSPYAKLRDYILQQSDFPKKHADILRFRDHFCREAVNSDTVAESEHWLYCVDTNSKLLPKFLYDLAYSYVVSNNYEEEMDRICRHIGKLSDDLDSIVDKHSGYMIKPIDMIDEDEYNDAGFKVSHADIMEAGIGDRLQTEGTGTNAGIDADVQHVLGRKTKTGKKVFEDPTTQQIYNIASALCEYMSVDFDVIEGRIMPLSIEFVKNLDSAEAYKAKQEKAAKKNIKIVSYATYFDQNKIYYTSCITFVAIQTAIPSFTPRKTFPGCIFSFGGYPLEADESNPVGLKYMACVIESIKTTVEPWNSISNQKRDTILQRLMELMTKRVTLHVEVADLYLRKKQHMDENPEAYSIPEDHSISKWTQFQPPIVKFSVLKTHGIDGISKEFRDDLADALKKGGSSQRNLLGTVYQKIISNTYGVIESVNSIVATVGKEVLLRAGSIIFLENACCEDGIITNKKRQALDFFIEKDPAIAKYIDTVKSYSAIVSDTRKLCIAPYLTIPMGSKKTLKSDHVNHKFTEEQIYGAFIHYCKLNVDAPVPDDLQAYYPEKPAMDLKLDLLQTIDHLKKLGHNHSNKALQDLMQTVAHRNKVQVDLSASADSVLIRVNAFTDLVEHLSSEKVIELPLANHLTKLMDKAVSDKSDALNALKRYLMRANREMLEIINKNIVEFSSMKKQDKKKISEFLASVGTWRNMDDDTLMYKSAQFIKNCVQSTTKTVPSMLQGNGDNSSIGMHNVGAMKHWELSQQHEATIVRNITEYFASLNAYQKDDIVRQFFLDMEPTLVNLNLFAQNVPIGHVFDRESVQLLYIYIYYSVFHDLIVASNDEEYVRVEMAKVKQMRREFREDGEDEFFGTSSAAGGGRGSANLDEDDEDYENAIGDEYNILVGKKQDFKKQICQLLAVLIEMDMQNKAIINVNYEELSDKIYKAGKAEKKTITDRFETMTIEERAVENAMKKYKMGIWNAGEEKGLVRYDRKTYDKEVSGQTAANVANLGDVGVAELNEFDEANADADADREAYDIGNLGENYEDGAYYEEDMERNE